MIVAIAGAAVAQTLAFPAVDDRAAFYPTAYADHGGVTDWACADLTYGGHHGTDLGVGGFAGMDEGRTVTASGDGVVTRAHDGEFDRCTSGDCVGGGGFGNHVYVEHPDGRTTIYGHLRQWSVAVAVGDAVVCGQPLGEVGSSGYSTGPHLHLELRDADGQWREPFAGACGADFSSWTEQGAHGDLPESVCADPPACAPSGELGCGDVVRTRNDGEGATQQTFRYGCDDWVYTGPERAFTFRTSLDQPVTLEVDGLSADLDLHVVDDGGCDGDGCVAASSHPDAEAEGVTFPAVAGASYTVVLDGWQGAVSDFRLRVSCTPDPGQDTAPPPPTGDTAAPAPTADTAPPTDRPDTGAPSETGDLRDDPVGGGGCGGCDTGSVPGSCWALLVFGWLRRRR